MTDDELDWIRTTAKPHRMDKWVGWWLVNATGKRLSPSELPPALYDIIRQTNGRADFDTEAEAVEALLRAIEVFKTKHQLPTS